MDKIILDTRTGEKFIETAPLDWLRRLKLWEAYRRALKAGREVVVVPCPMPVGHALFSRRLCSSAWYVHANE